MRVFFVILSFAFLVLFPPHSLAVKFDIWETGMSIHQVVSLAFKNDIPIARDGIIHGSKKFAEENLE